LSSLAPLFGFEELHMSGAAQARLTRSEQDHLQFESEFDFNEIEADSLFMAEKIDGSVRGIVTAEPEIDFLVHVTNSTVSGQNIQNVRATGNTTLMEEETIGNIELLFSDGSESSLTHQGEFSITTDYSVLLTTLLDFET